MTTMKELLGESYKTKKIDDLVKDIAQMTKYNNHTGAVMELAKALGATNPIKAIKGIEMIEQAESAMPPDINKYRNYILKNLLKYAKREYSAEEYKLIHGAF